MTKQVVTWILVFIVISTEVTRLKPTSVVERSLDYASLRSR